MTVAGCGAIGSTGTTTAVSTPAASTHERPTPQASSPTAADGSATPTQAIRSFATLYINWTPADVAQQMSGLAARSVGQARAAMELAAAQTGHDYELRQGGIANRGSVMAIAALAGSRDRYAVVTRERTTAANTTAYQGLRPAWHVAIATVVELSAGNWVLSGWQPEN